MLRSEYLLEKIVSTKEKKSIINHVNLIAAFYNSTFSSLLFFFIYLLTTDISPQKSLSSSSASSSSGKRLESDSRLLDRCYGSNSGSDGSNCDACSEIIRMQCCANHDDSDCLSEDSFPFRTSLTASSSVCCASAVETNNSSLSQALNLTKLSNELSVLGKENLEKNKIPIALIPADSGAIQNLLVMAIPSCNYCGKNCHLKTFNNNANFLSEKCNSNNHSQIVNIKSLSSCVPESDYMAINGNTNSNHLMNYAKGTISLSPRIFIKLSG